MMAETKVETPTPSDQEQVFHLTHQAMMAVTEAYNLGYRVGRRVEREERGEKEVQE